jgi:outer membrane protein OmpA-like peptidoglycan-associated protein
MTEGVPVVGGQRTHHRATLRSRSLPDPRRTAAAAVVVVVVVLALVGCTRSAGSAPGTASASGDGGPNAGSSSPWTAGTPTSSAPAAAWQRVANYIGPNDSRRTALLRLYPLQRFEGHLLATIDLTPQGETAQGVDYFCITSSVCKNLGGVDLIDTQRLIRNGPLRESAATDADVVSSKPNIFDLSTGTTYRYGAFFPDPGGSSTTVNLQYGGVAVDVPIVDGGPTAPGLVTAEDGSVADTPPAPGGPDGTQLVLFPVREPATDAVADPHDLLAKVVGGTVNEGSGRKSDVVSIDADLLFAFDSAKLSARSSVLIAQAASILAAKADPAKPVTVVGYTDSKGTDDYNARLSTARAVTAASALAASEKLGGRTLTPSGRGAKDPVAPNTSGPGVDNPEGRALNRRVEIHYSPKPDPAPAVATPVVPSTGSSTGSAGGAGASATAAAGTASETEEAPAATLPTRGRVGGQPQSFSAAVYPVRRIGALTLVQVDVTPVGTAAAGSDYFSSQGRASHDIGSFALSDPATRRVYVPASDVDDPGLLTATLVKSGMNADRPYRLVFFTAAIPTGLSSIDVRLGPLGTAKAMPVVG